VIFGLAEPEIHMHQEILSAIADVPKSILIGGEWSDASGRGTFHSIDPASEQPIAEVARGGVSEIDAAVAAARTALTKGAWSAMTGADRGRL
jgi:acyl-CoA reductase-like NAD-dependent aldehyde dehydrogenase